jgi:NHLM bacteriocin system ABC transporter ATP-binding protein
MKLSFLDSQIKDRIEKEDAELAEALAEAAGAVMGKRISAAMNDDRIAAKNAIERILKYYHAKPRELPDEISDVNDQIDYQMRPHGIMTRRVKLEKGWHRNAIGAMIGIRKSDGGVVALLPHGFTGYRYIDEKTEQSVKITSKTEELLEEEAIVFYRPFPVKKMKLYDLIKYIFSTIPKTDVVMLLLVTAAVTGIGFFTPLIKNFIFSDVIMTGNYTLLIGAAVALVNMTLCSVFIGIISKLINMRINTRLSLTIQAASMMRVLSLPADFFKKYNSGEMTSRSQSMSSLCNMLVNTIFNTSLTSAFSLVYIGQVFMYAPGLVVPSLLITAATLAFSLITTFTQMKISREHMKHASKEYGMSYAMMQGVQKIKLAGAEKRMFARWGKMFAEGARLTYAPPVFIVLNPVINAAISLTGTIVMYYIAVKSGVSAADYIAFSAAYGMVSAAFTGIAGIATTAANIKPTLEMVEPIMNVEPEIADDKEILTSVTGMIELDSVSFRYDESMPPVIDDLSLRIRPGQYVAIVGKTGCGKSTLVRLLLGFEKPQNGSIYYDGKDMNSVDLRSLRNKIGVVLQNGKLFSGDIYSNIVISAPTLSVDDAWEAAETAGVADDIRAMPMGMFTMISEGSGGISGGQKQRLMIARAVAPKPRILILDEATSALDNITQKKVSEALDKLNCTRIVIAHRLSTIRQCDRIVVLDKGKIIEDGKYDELIARKGFFAELVERQRVNE